MRLFAKKDRVLKWEELTQSQKDYLYFHIAEAIESQVRRVSRQRAKEAIDPILKTDEGFKECDTFTIEYTIRCNIDASIFDKILGDDLS